MSDCEDKIKIESEFINIKKKSWGPTSSVSIMHVSIMHVSMMPISMIQNPDVFVVWMMHVCMFDPISWTLLHVSILRISMIVYPWPWCMYSSKILDPDQSVTFVKILIRMNVRIYSYQQSYTNEYPNIFILIFLTRTNVRISICIENCTNIRLGFTL